MVLYVCLISLLLLLTYFSPFPLPLHFLHWENTQTSWRLSNLAVWGSPAKYGGRDQLVRPKHTSDVRNTARWGKATYHLPDRQLRRTVRALCPLCLCRAWQAEGSTQGKRPRWRVIVTFILLTTRQEGTVQARKPPSLALARHTVTPWSSSCSPVSNKRSEAFLHDVLGIEKADCLLTATAKGGPGRHESLLMENCPIACFICSFFFLKLYNF